jgi:hypothetical protein
MSYNLRSEVVLKTRQFYYGNIPYLFRPEMVHAECTRPLVRKSSFLKPVQKVYSPPPLEGSCCAELPC